MIYIICTNAQQLEVYCKRNSNNNISPVLTNLHMLESHYTNVLHVCTLSHLSCNSILKKRYKKLLIEVQSISSTPLSLFPVLSLSCSLSQFLCVCQVQVGQLSVTVTPVWKPSDSELSTGRSDRLLMSSQVTYSTGMGH